MSSDRTSFYLTAELKAGLRQAAKRLGVTQTQIVQEALGKYLVDAERPKFTSIGAGADDEVSGATSEQWLRENWARRGRGAAPKRRA